MAKKSQKQLLRTWVRQVNVQRKIVEIVLVVLSSACLVCLGGGVYARDLEGWAGEGQVAAEAFGEAGIDQPFQLRTFFAVFSESVRGIFVEEHVVFSPLPVRLSGGIKPKPNAVFSVSVEEAEDRQKVLGVEKGSLPTKYYYKETREGLKVYSVGEPLLRGNTGDLVPVKGSTGLTKPGKTVERGEVWGARIATVEDELKSCITDSGVILGIIVLAILVGIWFLVVLVRKLFFRSS